ncbi:hypothetical protein J6590_093460 [Homalodisca vitripennis]|nr:hypothetical protein J6590_093460 [Homalodisca vitripennis]
MYQIPASLNKISNVNKKSEETDEPIRRGTHIAAPAALECMFCGYDRQQKNICPARNAICKGCVKKGHFINNPFIRLDAASCALITLNTEGIFSYYSFSKATVPIVSHLHASALNDT